MNWPNVTAKLLIFVIVSRGPWTMTETRLEFGYFRELVLFVARLGVIAVFVVEAISEFEIFELLCNDYCKRGSDRCIAHGDLA